MTVWCFGEMWRYAGHHFNELEGEDPQTVSRNFLSFFLVNVTSFVVEPFNFVLFCSEIHKVRVLCYWLWMFYSLQCYSPYIVVKFHNAHGKS